MCGVHMLLIVNAEHNLVQTFVFFCQYFSSDPIFYASFKEHIILKEKFTPLRIIRKIKNKKKS